MPSSRILVAFVGLAALSCAIVHFSGAEEIKEPPFRTDAVWSIAFGSCNKANRNQEFWQTIESSLRRLGPNRSRVGGFVWLGDIVYADTSYGPGIWVESSLETMKARYSELKNNKYYERFVATSELVAGVWDDHDMGRNDGGKEFGKKDEVQQLLLDFLDVPSDHPRRKRHGTYSLEMVPFPGHNSDYENIACFILLDTRYHRDPIVEERTGSILGEEQWAWLEETLKQIAYKEPGKQVCLATFIGSGVQVLSDEKPAEQWGNFRDDRERLFRTIRSNNVSRVTFLSGDVHLGEIQVDNTGCGAAVADEGTGCGIIGYPIVDVTASGLTHTVGDMMPTWLFDVLLPSERRINRTLRRNYGTISIHHERDSFSIQFTLFDVATGRTVVAFDVPLRNITQRMGSQKVAGRFRDGKFPPLKLVLVSIRDRFLPFLRLHQLIYAIIFGVLGITTVLSCALAAVVWRYLRYF